MAADMIPDATHTRACLRMFGTLWRAMSGPDRFHVAREFVPLPRGITSDDGWLVPR